MILQGDNVITISLCMIVKNDGELLARCLDSVKTFVDEIIIVDLASTDNTKAIGRKYTKNIFDFEWNHDFSAARNFSFSKAKKDYIMWLDANEIIPINFAKQINSLKKRINNVDLVTMKTILSQDENGLSKYYSTQERLLKRINNFKWYEDVQEYIPSNGEIYHSNIEIWQQKKVSGLSCLNKEIYESLVKSSKLSPRHTYYYAHQLKDLNLSDQAINYFEQFIKSNKGSKEQNINACFSLANCYKELGINKKILPILFKSFNYDIPRAEICAEIGFYYKNKNNYLFAFKWFDLGLNLKTNDSVNFIDRDYLDFVLSFECSNCLFILKNYQEAFKYNELARKYKPNDSAVLKNKKLLKNKLKKWAL